MTYRIVSRRMVYHLSSARQSMTKPSSCRTSRLPAKEFVCWAIVLLCPFLRYVNGPAVTDDQAVIQISLFASALIAAVSFRAVGLWRRST
jgi:hypothetical protein